MNHSKESELEDKLNKQMTNETPSANEGEKDKSYFNSDHKEKSGNNISDMLENELKSLRKNQDKMFFNFETNCKVEIVFKLLKNS